MATAGIQTVANSSGGGVTNSNNSSSSTGPQADVGAFVARLMSLSPQQLNCLHSDERLMRQLGETQMLMESRLDALNKFALGHHHHHQHPNQQLMLLAQHASHQHQLQQQQQQQAAAAAALAMSAAHHQTNHQHNNTSTNQFNLNNYTAEQFQHANHQPYFTHYVQLPIGIAVAGSEQQHHVHQQHLQSAAASVQQQQHQHQNPAHHLGYALDLSSPGATSISNQSENVTAASYNFNNNNSSASSKQQANKRPAGKQQTQSRDKKSRCKTTTNYKYNNNNNSGDQQQQISDDDDRSLSSASDDEDEDIELGDDNHVHETMLDSINNTKILNKIVNPAQQQFNNNNNNSTSATTNGDGLAQRAARRRRTTKRLTSMSSSSTSSSSSSTPSTSSTLSLASPQQQQLQQNQNLNNQQQQLLLIQATADQLAANQAILQNNMNNHYQQQQQQQHHHHHHHLSTATITTNDYIPIAPQQANVTTAPTTKRYKGEFDEPTDSEIEQRMRDLARGKENYHQLNWLSGECACVLGSKFTGSKTAGDVLGQIEAWRRLDVSERLAFKWSLDDLPQDIRLADIKRLEDLRRDASNGRADFGGASKRKPLGIRGTRQFLLILYCLWGHPGRQDAMQKEGYCPHCFAKIRKANDQSTLVRVVNHFNMKHRKGANPRLSPSA